MSWVGGKKALREILAGYLPSDLKRYVEVFGGGGWLYFHKVPSEFEVFNDFNGLLVNLYRCVREKPHELVNALQYQLNSREDFARIIHNHTDPAHIRITKDCNVGLAAEFYYLVRNSYASGLTSYACQPHDFWKDFPLINAAHRRLAKTVVENKDFGALVQQYDRPETFFYLDPPYFGTEDLYQNIGKDGFGLNDHIRLRDTLMCIEGRFLLSYNMHPFIFELYNQPGICITSVDRLHNMKQRFEGGAMYEEYIIANYDMNEARNRVVQLNIFDQMHNTMPITH